MRLSELKAVLSKAKLTGDAEIRGIRYESGAVQPGELFVALVGARADGHDYVRDAAARGAAAVMVERRVEGIDVPQLVVPDSRRALGVVSARFYGDPSKRLRVIGVTGTNGKTTTTWLVRSILEAAGHRSTLIGTIAYSAGGTEMPAPNTTPESLIIQRLLGETVKAGHEYAVMEVSSHSLDQGRVDDVHFAAGVFMNLSHEHIDYHKTMTRYARAKGRLFQLLSPEAVAVVNADDEYVEEVLTGVRTERVIRFGFGEGADVHLTALETDLAGSRFTVASPWGEMKLHTAMPGEHNVYNCLAAASVTAALDVPLDAVATGIARLTCVSGRLEPVNEGQDFAVFVDYAHTAEALKNVLRAVRKLTENRVIVVFGCGGDRDRKKRPKMREAAEKLADLCVVTSDNPRSEDPDDIIAQVMRGVRNPLKFTVEADRRSAIRKALGMARTGDLVIIAGKGHETYQIFRDRTIHFDDREVARELLREAVSA